MWRVLVVAIGLSAAILWGASYLEKSRPALPKYGPVSEFSLVNQEGKFFGSQDLKGKVWVVNFFFSRCAMVCPVVNAKVSALQKKFASSKNIAFVSISVDPEYDTVAVLESYRKKFSEWTPIWNFLTGQEQAISKLNHDTFKFDTLEDRDQHTTRLVLVDRAMQIRGYYSSEDVDAIKQLQSDIVALK